MDEECISMLADSRTVWVPTLVTVRNLRGCGRYEDRVLIPIIRKAEENLFLACQKKAQVALGSDAGAYMVMHGNGIVDEYTAFRSVLGDSDDLENWLRQGENEIKTRFRHPRF